MSNIIRIATKEDVSQILEISEKNYRDNRTEQEKLKGFTAYRPSQNELLSLIGKGQVVVGESSDGSVGGYEIFMTQDDVKNNSFFRDFYKGYSGIVFNGQQLSNQNPFIFAQTSIGDKCKGTTLSGDILKYVTELAAQQGYSIGIGEIDSENKISYNFHRKRAGFSDVGEYSSDGRVWKVMAKTLTTRSDSLEQRVSSTTAIIGLIGGSFFLSSNVTGNVIGLSNTTSSWIGGILILIGLIALGFWIKSKKKNKVVVQKISKPIKKKKK